MLTAKEKELKQRYIDIVMEESWKNDSSMRKYYEKKIDRVVETEKGYLIAINKENIEKDFCFGYRLSSHDTEEYDKAQDAAYTASQSTEYFIEKNLSKFDSIFESLNELDVYTRVQYNNAPNNSIIRSLEYCRYYDRIGEDWEKISDSDRQNIIAAYTESKKDFEKRLQSYLKRYGMSKVNTWTYWMDE